MCPVRSDLLLANLRQVGKVQVGKVGGGPRRIVCLKVRNASLAGLRDEHGGVHNHVFPARGNCRRT